MGGDHLKEIATLRSEVESLKVELADIRARYDAKAERAWKALNVTSYQARVVVALASGRIMTRDHLMQLCLRADSEHPRHVDSQIKRIRKHNPGLVITSVYGAGYVMEGESLARVRAAINEEAH